MGRPVACLAKLARGAGHRSAGDHHRVASPRLSPVLDLEVRWGKPGRPAVPREVRDLIRQMSCDNPLWGAPHIHGELLKLGITIGETSVAKYMVRRRRPPSQTWR